MPEVSTVLGKNKMQGTLEFNFWCCRPSNLAGDLDSSNYLELQVYAISLIQVVYSK
jgi:hypothetical protein